VSGVASLTALFREIHFAALMLDGINSVFKGGNELPHSMCEFRNSQNISSSRRSRGEISWTSFMDFSAYCDIFIIQNYH